MDTIPKIATEQVKAYWETGVKRSADYYVANKCVGCRGWTSSGVLEIEFGLEDDRRHGLFRTWHANGQLCEEVHYEHGKEHGLSKQYDETGLLIGSYRMKHGTGLDLWFHTVGILSEERSLQAGNRHGYERWWNGDNRTVWREGHYWHGVEHGIFRKWNQQGRLCRGYPQYYVAGQRMMKKTYEKACRTDVTLPRFVKHENYPDRSLPKGLRL